MVRNTQIRFSHSSWLRKDYDESVYDELAAPPPDNVILGCLEGIQCPQQVKLSFISSGKCPDPSKDVQHWERCMMHWELISWAIQMLKGVEDTLVRNN